MIWTYKKILLATDGSENANRATSKAIQLQKIFNADVIAFHAVEYHRIPTILPLPMPFAPTYTYQMTATDTEAIRRKYLEAGQRLIAATRDKFNKAGLEVETRLIQDQSPEDYVLDTVEKENIDLVIIGCKGDHSRLERIFLGTVAQKLTNEAPCDVLVVR